uniref:Fe2OG dioxygenase domain-containing protein n=1 Tax=Rhodosorus marinus TaxID=101924 RepID=A0A7S3A3X7_9RHOD|mmetsp:Transcript_43904/g.171588  ORF Transcript_43904/g.171588 Transcript_43904/m.171588 type:complete len:368 (+) Transcript_43904:101-1204(+)
MGFVGLPVSSLGRPRGRCAVSRRERKGGGCFEAEAGLLPAATELNYAKGWKDILEVTVKRQDELRNVHMVVALLRMAKQVVRLSRKEERDVLVIDNRFKDLVDAVFDDQANVSIRHLSDAVWACGMLLAWPGEPAFSAALTRLGNEAAELLPKDKSNVVWACERLGVKDRVPPNIQSYIDSLPFKTLPGVLDKMELNVLDLRKELDLKREVIQLKDKRMEESRLTAWQHQNGKPFLYSGKTMEPSSSFTPIIDAVATELAAILGVEFDGVLINYYEDARCGMRYHSDPDQGLYWTRDTAVVSVGDTRLFCFRRIDDNSTRHEIWVNGGDVVFMTGDCQETYQHCVKVESERQLAGPRISLVYKKSMS